MFTTKLESQPLSLVWDVHSKGCYTHVQWIMVTQ